MLDGSLYGNIRLSLTNIQFYCRLKFIKKIFLLKKKKTNSENSFLKSTVIKLSRRDEGVDLNLLPDAV